VLDGSPAKAAGLQVGDVIVEFNGKPVMRSSSLPPLVGRAKVGKEADVTVIRDRKSQNIGVLIAELPTSITQAAYTPEPEPKANQRSALGMSVEGISDEVGERLRIEAGVQVTGVDESGAASDAGILRGDVITMIDNREVSSIDDFETISKNLKSGKSVALLVQRRGGPVFLAIRPEDS
jgi:serine protease Do